MSAAAFYSIFVVSAFASNIAVAIGAEKKTKMMIQLNRPKFMPKKSISVPRATMIYQ